MRLFSTRSKQTSANIKSSKQDKDVSARILLPNHGAIVMNHGGQSNGGPVVDNVAVFSANNKELTGELEVHNPRGSGRKRCRAIRIRLRQVSRLNMGKPRGWERDVLFERTIEHKGAIILEEGVQRYKFTISVPYGLAPFNVTPAGDVRLSLIAEVDGITGSNSMSVGETVEDNQNGGYWAYKHWLAENGRRVSGSDGSSGNTTPDYAHEGPPAINIRPIMTVSWNDPVTSSDEEIPWMRGSVTAASRCICMMYNPDSYGNLNSLHLQQSGDVPGLGVFDSRFQSDVWTVCALLKTTLSIPAPSPATVVYYLRVLLEQTVALTSPRDCEETQPLTSMTPFVVWENGTRPPNKGAGRAHPAIWRGTAAGGSDSKALHVSGVGRLPNDETGRPSTLEGIITPLHVSHKLVVEVFYAVDGEDVYGNAIAKTQPAPIRLLRIEKPTILPSCGIIPEAIELPTYDEHQNDTCFKPCGTCKLTPNDQVCRVCDLTSLLHPRHDLYEFGPNGTCPACASTWMQSEEKSKWVDCACGSSMDKMAERMARVIPPDVDSVGDCLTDSPLMVPIKMDSRPATPLSAV